VEAGKSDLEPQLMFYDRLFYALCQRELEPWDKRKGMVCFNIPLYISIVFTAWSLDMIWNIINGSLKLHCV
jgi:hypothetical protein